MATLIRLKQIESSSALQVAAEIGTDFSGSVFEIIDGAGIFSSSAQVELVSASGYTELATDIEVAVVSSSISTSISILSQTYVTTASFHSYTASLGDTFATDYEVYVTNSMNIDQGEF